MQPRDCLITMAQYNRRMNAGIDAVCTDLPDSERKRDWGAFYNPLNDTLNRLLLADRLSLSGNRIVAGDSR